MEIRISIPINHVSEIFDSSYTRLEGGSWFCETIDTTRRTFDVLTRFYLGQKNIVIEILSESDPDSISLPFWQQELQKCKQTQISDYIINYFPHSHILCCSLKSLEDPIVIEWLNKAGLLQEEIHVIKQEAQERQTLHKAKEKNVTPTPSFTHPKGIQVGSLCAPAVLTQNRKAAYKPVYSFVDDTP